MTLLVINFDSAFDWAAEVRQFWEGFDWEGFSEAVAPQISSELTF